MRLGQVSQCYVILKNLHPSAFVNVHSPKALPTQRLENIRVAHQAQVTRCRLSYEAVLFSSATVPGETLHSANMFAVVQEGPAEGLFEK